MSYRIKLAVFVLSAVLFLFVLDTAYQGLNTLRRLDVVESERDQWANSCHHTQSAAEGLKL